MRFVWYGPNSFSDIKFLQSFLQTLGILLSSLLFSLRIFPISVSLNGSLSLSDDKPLLISRALLSILAVLNNSVVWTVFTRPLISKSLSPYYNLLVNVPRAPITIGITVTFIFYRFFNSLARSRYLSFCFLSFNFTLLSAGIAKSTILPVLSFFFC